MLVPACGNGRARAEHTRARRSPLEVGVYPRARRSPLKVSVHPRTGRSPLEGGVRPRARRSLLEWTFEWAALVGRGGRRSVGRALCVRLSKICLTLVFFRFCFFQVLSGVSPIILADPRGCPRQKALPDSSRCPSSAA
jgi:hypothetical protein